MASHYQQLCAEERACIMQMTAQGHSLRQIARQLRRAPSSISRELRRNAAAGTDYNAAAANYAPAISTASSSHRVKAISSVRRAYHVTAAGYLMRLRKHPSHPARFFPLDRRWTRIRPT